MQSASSLTQIDYAESWLWVHFLLSGDAQSRAIIQQRLSQLRNTGKADSMLPVIAEQIPDYENQLIMHLRVLANSQPARVANGM
jgi:hypothetical protein